MRSGDLIICNDVIGVVTEFDKKTATVASTEKDFKFKIEDCAIIAPAHAIAALTYKSLLKTCGKEL